ncbi:acyl-ACP--UDP-N-acetylglucosamine O-acyltransferase [Xiashengella succiniciproducens]|jgi:UDP-N-acetylglucosamine acyltransferase|uniref:Acyl-ACP--UDP-N-acetylglucosamine O-acyltransferase n=1 Tax=Xiashengella succiniciproducens TaxID=2949635 RepID=A0A9J6ZPL4_9BACT|nr:acyl-ACP--UDP-N-acetylglucosamine O-acyltransferase [Alkaliflexus sp. Ai-910]URW79571.1 acyl-ACP--UDP-N-acetylglucosamine O-acyltransferase [Alkaliflexus sp. Ai-910]HHU00906.1 acyl-ACP--UDP-N-acetylglucosamine O-acyltransferase [Bacteroidales bacterium]
MNHPLSVIHPEAQIGPGVEIGPFVTIDKNVIIGEGTRIGSNATILSGTRIGKNCNIFPGAVIGAVPQDLKFAGEETTVEIGDNTTIREFATINRGTKAKGKTVIGNNCLIMAYVHVAHDCAIGNNVILVNSVQVAGEVEIDDWAIVGGTTAIHQFVRIGAHVMVAGGSLVSKDIPPYVKAGRERLSYMGVNSIGLRRRGFTNEQIRDIQDCYRVLYLSKLNNTDALAKIESDLPPTQEREVIVSFVRNSQRGIIKGYTHVSEEEE